MLYCFFFLGLYLAVDYGDVLRVGSGANPHLLLEALEPSDFGLRAFDLSLGLDADRSALPVPEGKEKSDRGESSDGPGLEPGPPSKKDRLVQGWSPFGASGLRDSPGSATSYPSFFAHALMRAKSQVAATPENAK